MIPSWIPLHVVADLREGGYTDDEISSMSPTEVFHAWLKWKGVIDRSSILNLARAVIHQETIEGGPR